MTALAAAILLCTGAAASAAIKRQKNHDGLSEQPTPSGHCSGSRPGFRPEQSGSPPAAETRLQLKPLTNRSAAEKDKFADPPRSAAPYCNPAMIIASIAASQKF